MIFARRQFPANYRYRAALTYSAPAWLQPSTQLSGNAGVSLSGFVKSADREQARLFGSVSLNGVSYRGPGESIGIDTLNADLSLNGNEGDLSRFELTLGGYRCS